TSSFTIGIPNISSSSVSYSSSSIGYTRAQLSIYLHCHWLVLSSIEHCIDFSLVRLSTQGSFLNLSTTCCFNARSNFFIHTWNTQHLSLKCELLPFEYLIHYNSTLYLLALSLACLVINETCCFDLSLGRLLTQ
ncbi:hypothetical protein Lal_00045369, partial [Lupinus albus]